MKNLQICTSICVCICIIYIQCLKSVRLINIDVQNKSITNGPVKNKKDKQKNEYNYSKLKKKFNLENEEDEEEGKHNGSIGQNVSSGPSGQNVSSGPSGQNEQNEQNEQNDYATDTDNNTNEQQVNKMFNERKENIKKEYVKCMDIIEKEFKDKTDNSFTSVKNNLENLCMKKKTDDEINEEIKKNKKIKEIKENNKYYSIEKKNEEIKSQLGLSSKIKMSNDLLNELLSEIKNCVHNYRVPCPLNWTFTTNEKELSNRGSIPTEPINQTNYQTEPTNQTDKEKELNEPKEYCAAPESYNGPCSKTINSNTDISEKILIEKKCKVYWECDNSNCVQDFDNNTCPLDWTQISDKYCKAPEHYTGKCLTKINFINMTNKQKSIYSNLCEVKWPCKEKCQRDYSVLCPENWVEVNDGSCVATNNYQGNCVKKLFLKHLNKNMKYMYEQKCQFNYPCINNECKKNYNELCPNLWIAVNDNECTASEYYNGSCNENYIFKKKNIEEKKQFEKICDVTYKCMSECKRNYSYNCPLGWKETLSYCLAPSYYTYNCSKFMKVNMTKEQKINISKKCYVYWPCSNYEILLKNLISDVKNEESYLSLMSGPIDSVTGVVVVK